MAKRHARSSLLLLAMLCVPLVAGCGKSRNQAPMGKVKGTVTFKGAPLATGEIQFLPQNGRSAAGTITDGSYELTTYEPGDGAIAGGHTVVISAMDYGEFDPNAPKEPPPPKSLIPQKYGAPNTSGLSAEVKAGEENVIDFELKDER